MDKILSCFRIKLSNSQTIILDGVDTGVSISDFILHLRRKNADVLDIYFTLLDAAGISPSLDFNQNAKAKDRGSWVPFKVSTQKLQKRKVLLLTVLYATWQKPADYQYQTLDSFYIQRILIQNLIWQHENSRE